MSVQRFYDRSGSAYVDYSVQDVDYDYANVVVPSLDGSSPVGIGYVMREAVALPWGNGEGKRRWFAYDSGACSGIPCRRIGDGRQGHATMEGAIKALLATYIEEGGPSCIVSGGAKSEEPTYGYYSQKPIVLSMNDDTDEQGHLLDGVRDAIMDAGDIHVITARIICSVTDLIVSGLWRYRGLLANDGTRVVASVRVDTPVDSMCGDSIIDTDRPFDGMTLDVAVVPSPSSVMPKASLSVSVVDVENSVDKAVMVGTIIVSGHGSDDGLGVLADSLTSEIGGFEDIESFATRLVATLMSGALGCAVAEYQSRIPDANAAQNGAFFV